MTRQPDSALGFGQEGLVCKFSPSPHLGWVSSVGLFLTCLQKMTLRLKCHANTELVKRQDYCFTSKQEKKGRGGRRMLRSSGIEGQRRKNRRERASLTHQVDKRGRGSGHKAACKSKRERKKMRVYERSVQKQERK